MRESLSSLFVCLSYQYTTHKAGCSVAVVAEIQVAHPIKIVLNNIQDEIDFYVI